ncbi:hypothetical protein M0R72_19595 [Candidatus Pacearchaeota archaeon]|jgi:hypothetical protein|nr:hypothetical protein [Candidatus Pacearchaeota archaeon]
MTELEEQIRLVKELRIGLADEKKCLDETYKIWESENRHTIESAAQISKDLAEEEARLRELTLAAYQETGNKKPTPGVGIRVVKKAEYEPGEALTWAKKHDACLTLDEKAYKTALIAGIFADAPGKVVEEPQATIAKELI